MCAFLVTFCLIPRLALPTCLCSMLHDVASIFVALQPQSHLILQLVQELPGHCNGKKFPPKHFSWTLLRHSISSLTTRFLQGHIGQYSADDAMMIALLRDSRCTSLHTNTFLWSQRVS
ncbi:hypothetical protein BGZ60DRAFT_3730 [Tricladium varicosporioides]|nr:hypothetical protein BGZ60DRAFT_3730 [Hymenoscyphus varicosporioides]